MHSLVLLVCFSLYLTTFAPAAEAGVEISAPLRVGIGQPFLVTVRAEEGSDGIVAVWQGKECLLSGDGKTCTALLGTDLKNAAPGRNSLVIRYFSDGETKETVHNIDLEVRKYPREELKVSPKQLVPPPELSERIKKEAALGRAALRTSTPGSAPSLPLFRPVPGIYTSVYGKSRYFNGQFKGRHGGVDMRAAVGTPIKAAAAGKVVLTGNFWFAGKCVYIDHGAGVVSFYCHMSKISKGIGEDVKRGEQIGLSGKSGRVTGPHLHFSVSWMGEFFDPAPLLDMQQ